MILIKLLLIILGILLGSLGGSANSSKGLRRFGVPGLLCIYSIIKLYSYCGLSSLWFITIMFASFVLSIGHGIPDINDEGSALGRFWYKIFRESKWTNICVRGTIGLLFALCLLAIPILKGNWFIYILSSLGIILSFALISWRNWGCLSLKSLELLKSDLITYSLVMLFSIGFLC